MKILKTFDEFLTEGILYEKEDGVKKSSKISPELDMPQRHDWVDTIIMREWNKLHNNEMAKAEEEGRQRR